MAIRSITPQPSDDWSNQPTSDRTNVRADEHSAAQVAARLGVLLHDLLAANPQIPNPDKLTAGMEIHIPPRPADGDASTDAAEGTSGRDTPSVGSKQAEARLSAVAMRSMLSSPVAASGTAAAAQAAPAPAPDTQPYLSTDPRFSDFNSALDAGNGEDAMAAARKLIAELQAQKPPDTQLINKARLGLVAGAMMSGKLDEAQKALLSVPAKTLDETDKKTFEDMRDLLKDVRRDSFSNAFEADTAPDAQVKDRGKAAADQARALLEVLQKTEPGNTPEIDEAKLKLANALLLGGHYREAEKAVAGINEQKLASPLREYSDAIRQEIHAEQIDALATAYGRDMKHQHYKDAVSNATAMMNDLAKYFPDAKDRLMGARLDLAAAQLMTGDVKGARKSLGRVTREEFQAAPQGMQQRYKELSTYADKAAQEQAEHATIQHELENIHRLAAYGDKDTKNDAVAKAQQLLVNLQQKYPNNTEAIDEMKLQVADVKLMVGDKANVDDAQKLLQEVIKTTDEPEVKERAELLQAQANLEDHPPQPDQAVKALRNLMENGSTPEIRKTAKEMVVHLEKDYLKTVYDKIQLEKTQLDGIARDKWGANAPSMERDGSSPFSGRLNLKVPAYGGPVMDYDRPMRDKHSDVMDELAQLQYGVKLTATVIKDNGLTLAELKQMDANQLAKLPGVSADSKWQTETNVKRIQTALAQADVQVIARDDFGGKHLSWDKNQLYVDPSYLDSPIQAASKWIGEQVRTARRKDDELKKSDSVLERMIGTGSAAILDAVSTADTFVKDKIKVAYDYYNKKGGIIGELGRGATFVADQVSSLVTMPATIADYKASDEERAGAVTGTLIMVGTAGMLKAGGPTIKAMGGRIAGSRLGQYIANSWVGDAARAAKSALTKEIRFGGKLTPSQGFEDGVKKFLGNKSADELRASVTENDIADWYEKAVETRRKQLVREMASEGKSAAEIDHAMDNKLSRREIIKQLQQEFKPSDVRRFVLGDRIYSEIYHGEIKKPLPEGLTQEKYARQLDTAKGQRLGSSKDAAVWKMADGKGYIMEENGWQVRQSEALLDETAVKTGKDIRRFYFNVKPEKAAELADFLTTQLKNGGVKFNLKLPVELEGKGVNFNRPDSLVMYVEKADYQAVKKMVLEYSKAHPEAFAEGTPAFTKAIGKGIAAAEEPLQGAGLPANLRGAYSHGQLRSDLIAQTIVDAPPGVRNVDILQLARQRMHWHDLDVNRPWLSKGTNADDL